MLKSLVAILFIFTLSPAQAAPKERVRLDVPLVKQGHSLCGPATIEMVLRYWGETHYNQYDIAYNILLFKPDATRVKKSGVFKEGKVDWSLYPGTGTSIMREFLKQFSPTKNHYFKALSTNQYKAERQRDKVWGIVKNYLSNGVPVIVHQYWSSKSRNGHYRVVTGYNDNKKLVYLNDANPGREVIQTYEEFFALWNVDEPWLHYNAIAFNISGHRLNMDLVKYTQ